MLDDQHDKQMMRNQMMAIIMMTVLLLVWYSYFVPEPQPPRPVPQQSVPAAQDDTGAAVAPSGAPAEEESVAPGLPPIPEQTNPEADEVVIADDYLELVFTRIGGRLKEAHVLLGENGKNSVQLVPASKEGTPDTAAVYPLGLRFTDESLSDALDRRRFEAKVDASGRRAEFSIELPERGVLRKFYALGDRPHVLEIQIEYENRSGETARLGYDTFPAYVLNWGPKVEPGSADNYFKPSFIWRREEANEVLQPDDLPAVDGVPEPRRVPDAEWLGYKTKYFMVAFKPEFAGSDGVIQGTADQFRFGMTAPRFEVEPGTGESRTFAVYVGPLELRSLNQAWDTLPAALRFFQWPELMDWFAKLLLSILNWFHAHLIANYGVAIVLLTVLVRVVVFPLTLKGMRNMKKMQALAPEIEELRGKFKDDQQELSRKMMELYRDRGINPLGGCLPLFLQTPVFIALYRMLWNAFELRGAPFLWIDDLSQPDRLFRIPFAESLPFVGPYLEYFNLLPILSAAAMVLNMKLTPTAATTNPQQKMMMTLMPILFSVFCYPLAAGLNLYVFTSTVLGMAQQALIRPTVTVADLEQEKHERQEARKKRKQHFYTRAQERKRQQTKEARKRKAKPKVRAKK